MCPEVLGLISLGAGFSGGTCLGLNVSTVHLQAPPEGWPPAKLGMPRENPEHAGLLLVIFGVLTQES